MAESIQQAAHTAALETSLEDQVRAGRDDVQHNLSLLGRNLERLMEAIRGEQGEIQVRLDTDSGTATQLYGRHK